MALPNVRAGAAPVAALLVAFLALAAGRGARPLLACAAGLGILAGWLVLAPDPLTFLHPARLLGRLPGVGLLAVAMGVISLRGPPWLSKSATAVLGAFAGAWLAGATGRAGLNAALPPVLAGAALAFLFARSLKQPSQSVVAAAVLAGGLMAAGTPAAWPLAAMVVGAAALASVGGATLSPVAVALAGLAVAADLAHGRFRAGFNAVDAACLTPLLALWLLPRIERRIIRINVKNLGPWSAAMLTVAVVIAAAWVAARYRHG